MRKVKDNFVLSFVLYKIVYHVNIVVNDHLIEVGGVFVNLQSIHEVVEYFQRNPIFNGLTLGDFPQWIKEKPSIKTLHKYIFKPF